MAVGFMLASPALPQNPSPFLPPILHSHSLSHPYQVFSSQIISSCITSLSEKPLHGSSEELQLGKQLSEERKKQKEKKKRQFSLAANFAGSRSVLARKYKGIFQANITEFFH